MESGVEMKLFFQKRFGSGLFGGEGFIMQQFLGNGIVFLEIDGSVVEYEFRQGSPCCWIMAIWRRWMQR